MPAFGLYSHIQSNRRRSALLIAGLFFLVYALAYAGALLGRALGEGAYDGVEENLRGAAADMIFVAPVATVVVLIWITIAYFGHQKMIDVMTGSRPISRSDDPRLYRMLENLCISRGMTTPKLKIMETDALNAFASGLNDKQYAVTLTRGLVERLEDAEIEAVIAHELTHIRNEDVRMMVVAGIIAGVISFFGEIMFRGMRFRALTGGRRGGGGGRAGGAAIVIVLIAVAIIVVAWLLSIVIRFALSRSREFLADAGAVELTKNPDAMISALLKIETRAELEGAPGAIIEMCVENPRKGFTALLATHPTIDSRVAALERHAGGRRPPPEALVLRETPAEIAAREAAAAEAAAHGGDQGTGDSRPGPLGPLGPLGGPLGGPWGGAGGGGPWGGPRNG
ncbi:MAG: peptidase M48 Ste24p [Salinarimonadaceae bacterium]|nr:MAG: peptidase M48 Ste24p [Salinarimonadaceae bacterium]